MTLMEVRAVSTVYSGDFQPDNFGNSSEAVQELTDVFNEMPAGVLETILPSLHRIQRIFGDAGSIPRTKLAENSKIDLRSFMKQPDDVVAQVDTIIGCLESAEIILLDHFVYNNPLIKRTDQDRLEDIDARSKIIRRVVWKSWLPWESQNVGLVDSLLGKTLANLDFTKATQYISMQRMEKDLPSDEHCREVKLAVATAEDAYLDRERENEFLELSRGTLIEEFQLGESIESIAANHAMNVDSVKKQLLR